MTEPIMNYNSSRSLGENNDSLDRQEQEHRQGEEQQSTTISPNAAILSNVHNRQVNDLPELISPYTSSCLATYYKDTRDSSISNPMEEPETPFWVRNINESYTAAAARILGIQEEERQRQPSIDNASGRRRCSSTPSCIYGSPSSRLGTFIPDALSQGIRRCKSEQTSTRNSGDMNSIVETLTEGMYVTSFNERDRGKSK